MVNLRLTAKEYNLLKDCLKWNLYFYKERVYKAESHPVQFQLEQIKEMEELNGKI